MPEFPRLCQFATVHPHVRGAYAWVILSLWPPQRFIPTCVGRICILSIHRLHISGSSPRAWGVCGYILQGIDGNRFIPTCVGRIVYETIKCARTTVHPHVRGAYPTNALSRERLKRFIPTCVGRMDELRVVRAIHARFIPTCVGRIPIVNASFSRGDGSSPRAWGVCRRTLSA